MLSLSTHLFSHWLIPLKVQFKRKIPNTIEGGQWTQVEEPNHTTARKPGFYKSFSTFWGKRFPGFGNVSRSIARHARGADDLASPLTPSFQSNFRLSKKTAKAYATSCTSTHVLAFYKICSMVMRLDPAGIQPKPPHGRRALYKRAIRTARQLFRYIYIRARDQWRMLATNGNTFS